MSIDRDVRIYVTHCEVDISRPSVHVLHFCCLLPVYIGSSMYVIHEEQRFEADRHTSNLMHFKPVKTLASATLNAIYKLH